MKWIWILTVATMAGGPPEDQRVIQSPEGYASMGECQTMSWVAEQALKANGWEMIDNSCELVKDKPE